jgi:hypothetical protein
MAQILSILALSTTSMTERRTSGLIYALCPSRALADYGSEKFLKRLIGKTDVEDALLRLDLLTKEESLMAVAKILEVADRVEGDVKEIKVLAGRTPHRFLSLFMPVLTPVSYRVLKQERMNDNVCDSSTAPSWAIQTDTLTGKEMQEKLRTWLSPPDCSINHNNACKTQHDGTATWFIQGTKFREWKNNGSLLWINGNRTPFSPGRPDAR